MAIDREGTFYVKNGKRMLDVLGASLGLVVLSPVFALLALLVRLSSPGPVLFMQARVGCCGKVFRIAKFRSMFVDTDRRGLAITSAGDSRITRIGRVLRRFKLDELPQLWNVLIGEMSFVGPRPEVPGYVEHYSPSQRQVLTVRPGITDLASITYRHEETILGEQDDPDRYYREVVLPHKLDLNLEYVRQMSFSYDFRLMLRTVACVFLPAGLYRGTQERSRI